MFLNKFFHFLKGYVILNIMGFKIERFLYISAKRGIDIRDISKKDGNSLTLRMSIRDFSKVRSIARKTGTRVKIIKKAGLPIIFHKYRKRCFLFFGLGAFLIAVFLSSQFILAVEIRGAERTSTAEIKAVLEDGGVKVGALKLRMRKPSEVKNMIINRIDNISWAWIYLKGTKVVCEVYEDYLPQISLEDGEVCDVLASRDGIIKRIIAYDGKKMVSAGDTVLAGDVLISGTLYNSSGEVGAKVSASGDVEAYTWHEKKGTYKLYYETKIPTGNKKTFRQLNLFSKTLNLYFDKNIEYENYILEKHLRELKGFGGAYLGVGLLEVTAIEVDLVREPISYDMAVYEGKCDLEEKIAKELLPGAELVEENVFHRPIDDETVEVSVTMEFIEKIGRCAPVT